MPIAVVDRAKRSPLSSRDLHGWFAHLQKASRRTRKRMVSRLRPPQVDAVKVGAAEKLDGKFVVMSNDDKMSAEDIALGYKAGWNMNLASGA